MDKPEEIDLSQIFKYKKEQPPPKIIDTQMPKIEKGNIGEHFRSFCRVENAFHVYKKLGSYNTAEMENKRLHKKAKQIGDYNFRQQIMMDQVA